VNGNLNCASSSSASCQTTDGKTVCVRNHGDVVQSFGKGTSPGSTDDSASVEKALENRLAEPVIKQRLEQRDAAGHRLLLERNGTKLHVGTDRLSIDRK
jgi:hypothetical protein